MEELHGKKKRTRSAIGRASRNKGKVMERLIANMLTARGMPARRAVQFDGLWDYDVKVDLPFNFECKAVENLNLYKAMQQSKADASRKGDTALVVHKKNNNPILATMEFTDFINLLQYALGYVDEENTLELMPFREKWIEEKKRIAEADELL